MRPVLIWLRPAIARSHPCACVLNLLDGNLDEAGKLLEQAKAAGVKEAAANLDELRKKEADNQLFDSFE